MVVLACVWHGSKLFRNVLGLLHVCNCQNACFEHLHSCIYAARLNGKLHKSCKCNKSAALHTFSKFLKFDSVDQFCVFAIDANNKIYDSIANHRRDANSTN